MRYTLLEAVQLIQSSMDSDEVNSYDDTVESLQIARLLKSVYYDLATDLQLPEHETLFELDPSGDPAKPVLMTIPSNVTKVNWIKYNCALDTDPNAIYREVNYKNFTDFYEIQAGLYQQTTSVGEMSFLQNGETFEVMYRTDEFPIWYTTVDDYTLLFNGFRSDIDTTLQKSKTMCHGTIYPVFTMADDFIPDLDPTQFSLWLNTAKTRAFNELKQVANQESNAHARRQKIASQWTRRRAPDLPEVYKVPRYGRRGWSSDRIPKYLKNGE